MQAITICPCSSAMFSKPELSWFGFSRHFSAFRGECREGQQTVGDGGEEETHCSGLGNRPGSPHIPYPNFPLILLISIAFPDFLTILCHSWTSTPVFFLGFCWVNLLISSWYYFLKVPVFFPCSSRSSATLHLLPVFQKCHSLSCLLLSVLLSLSPCGLT